MDADQGEERQNADALGRTLETVTVPISMPVASIIPRIEGPRDPIFEPKVVAIVGAVAGVAATSAVTWSTSPGEASRRP